MASASCFNRGYQFGLQAAAFWCPCTPERPPAQPQGQPRMAMPPSTVPGLPLLAPCRSGRGLTIYLSAHGGPRHSAGLLAVRSFHLPQFRAATRAWFGYATGNRAGKTSPFCHLGHPGTGHHQQAVAKPGVLRAGHRAGNRCNNSPTGDERRLSSPAALPVAGQCIPTSRSGEWRS